MAVNSKPMTIQMLANTDLPPPELNFYLCGCVAGILIWSKTNAFRQACGDRVEERLESGEELLRLSLFSNKVL